MPSQQPPIPSWLEAHPSTLVLPPVHPAVATLPFDQLHWEDFERLCLRLARAEGDVEDARLYGVRGEKQDGIDLYVRPRTGAKYRVYQCKKYKKLTSTAVKKAIDAFEKGEWAGKSGSFYFCTSHSLEPTTIAKAIEKGALRLRGRGIALVGLGREELSEALRSQPTIVHDFFGPAWVAEFLGQDAAEKFKNRLSPGDVQKYLSETRDFYRRIFYYHDPGIGSLFTPINKELPSPSPSLKDRFVVPDLEETWTPEEEGWAQEGKGEVAPHSQASQNTFPADDLIRAGAFIPSPEGIGEGGLRKQAEEPQSHLKGRRGPQSRRVSAPEWLAQREQAVILGKPGSGKSTLSRFITLDLLDDEPTLYQMAAKWGSHLPLWFPFAHWSELISNEGATAISITDGIKLWLHKCDSLEMWHVVEKAMEDERLLLLVDGVDEWSDESAAQRAMDRLRLFVEKRGISVVAFSRPHGFRRLVNDAAGWSVTQMAGFSTQQQKKLVYFWIRYHHHALEVPPNKISE